MHPTKIINPGLGKPWLLISAYEQIFDQYIEMNRQLTQLYKRYGRNPVNYCWQDTARANELKGKIKYASESMRGIDEAIHAHIRNHNKPHRLRLTA